MPYVSYHYLPVDVRVRTTNDRMSWAERTRYPVLVPIKNTDDLKVTAKSIDEFLEIWITMSGFRNAEETRWNYTMPDPENLGQGHYSFVS